MLTPNPFLMKLFHLICSLSIFLVITSATSCIAATFYVATGGVDANDVDGSVASPWATISYALRRVPDGSLILVKPGLYQGRVRLNGQFPVGVTVRSEETYKAILTNNATVVTSFYGQGITLEGFEILHDGDGAGGLVIQIQDLIDEPGGADRVSRISIINNIIHDSYNNDLLKINNGCTSVTVQGNIFYNQEGSDEHIDINSVTDVVVQDNLFFNDFSGSGRTNANDTSSYIVIKDSNGNHDGIIGSQNITVQRNIFFNWEGSTGSNFVLVGEDGNSYFEGQDIYIKNNLMLGNSNEIMRAPFGVKGGKNIYFLHNTISGNLPASAYGMRLNTEGSNPANVNIVMANNIWSDPTGTMGSRYSGDGNDFSDTPPSQTTSFTLNRNLYWNGGSSIPSSTTDLVNYSDDSERVVENPILPSASSIILPGWDRDSGVFKDGSATISNIFKKMVNAYGRIPVSSPAVNRANQVYAETEDILQQRRSSPDLGAFEYISNTSPTITPVHQLLLIDAD